MKRLLSLVVATILCLTMTVVASAETNEISFPMTINTGIVNFGNTTTISTNFSPETPADDGIVIKTNYETLITNKVALVIEGERYSRNYSEKVEYEFANYADEACTQEVISGGSYWKLGLFANTAHTGEFLVNTFSKIYGVTIVLEAYGEIDEESVYNAMGTTVKSFVVDPIFTIVSDFAYDTALTEIISQLVVTAKDLNYISKNVVFDYPFLPVTDVNADGIISRNEVLKLSYSKLGKGNGVIGFEGFVSQIAAFFNKKNNGKITFNLTTAPATVISEWDRGGIPDYNTGIFATIATKIPDSVVSLFFNYDSTGSLIATSKIDRNGTIVFDISDILTDIGGNTLATFDNVYYSLIGGITYDDYLVKGVKIESVTLSYEEDDGMEVETTIPVVIDDDEEDDIDPDEDIIVDTDEVVTEAPITKETTVKTEADVVIVTDDTTEGPIVNTGKIECEDENPHTSVALTFIPTLIAGAVIVVASRKKK